MDQSPPSRPTPRPTWWQALLRSPSRALLALLVLVAALVILTRLLSAADPQAAAPQATAPSAPAGTGPATGPEPDPAAGRAATSWAARWLTHGHRPAEGASWRAALAPTTTPEYLGLLSSVDLTQVPTGTVTGPAQLRTSPGGASAIALVPTSADGLVLRLTLVRVPGRGWQISNADRTSP
jgi:hypothetical protein